MPSEGSPGTSIELIMNSYKDRNVLLLELGYKTYYDYLQSDLWKTIRTRVYTTKGDKCTLCPTKASFIHHRAYSKNVLLGKDIKPLVPICSDCHQKVEFKKTGKKRKLDEVQVRFDNLKVGIKRGKKSPKKVRQCSGVGCQNIPKRGQPYCTPYKESTSQVKQIVKWLNDRKKK